MKALKLNSLASLQAIAAPQKQNPKGWEQFLKNNGHSEETFSYLPEHLQLSLKVCFAKKDTGEG